MIKIIGSLFSNKRKPKEEEMNPEMTNLVNSMFLCNPLYDKLKVICHPDRFVDENYKAQAENLFQELQKCKYNYVKLLEVELQINDLINKVSKKINIQ